MFKKIVICIAVLGLMCSCSAKQSQVSKVEDVGTKTTTPSYTDIEMQWIEPDPHSPVALISDYRYAFGTEEMLLAQHRQSATTINIVKKDRKVESAPRKGDSLTMDDEGKIEVKETEGDVEKDIPVLKQEAAISEGQGQSELALLSHQGGLAEEPADKAEEAVEKAAPEVTDSEGMVAARDSRGDMLATVYFSLDSHLLSSEAKRVLRTEVPESARVEVEGFTCHLGDEGYNKELSEKRARAVADFLKSEGRRIASVTGKGECCPVSEKNLVENRRAEVKDAGTKD